VLILAAAQFLATLCGAIFAGAAIYVNLVEHPARMSCGPNIAATVWVPSYKRAAVMQASLAIVSFLAGIGAWLCGGGPWWLAGAVLIGLPVPFTLFVIKPTNNQLLVPGRDPASADTRVLLERWARLHAVRSVLGLAATLLYLGLILRD